MKIEDNEDADLESLVRLKKETNKPNLPVNDDHLGVMGETQACCCLSVKNGKKCLNMYELMR